MLCFGSGPAFDGRLAGDPPLRSLFHSAGPGRCIPFVASLSSHRPGSLRLLAHQPSRLDRGRIARCTSAAAFPFASIPRSRRRAVILHDPHVASRATVGRPSARAGRRRQRSRLRRAEAAGRVRQELDPAAVLGLPTALKPRSSRPRYRALGNQQLAAGVESSGGRALRLMLSFAVAVPQPDAQDSAAGVLVGTPAGPAASQRQRAGSGPKRPGPRRTAALGVVCGCQARAARSPKSTSAPGLGADLAGRDVHGPFPLRPGRPVTAARAASGPGRRPFVGSTQ